MMAFTEDNSVTVFFGIGSNVDREKHLQIAVEELTRLFLGTPLVCSQVYESEALGFEGPPFYNLVAAVKTSMDLGSLQLAIREIEIRYGRLPTTKKFSSRALDIDILLYGNRVQAALGDNEPALPRPEILTSPFVLKPLSEIAPHHTHPELQKTYTQLWHEFVMKQEDVKLTLVTQLHYV